MAQGRGAAGRRGEHCGGGDGDVGADECAWRRRRRLQRGGEQWLWQRDQRGGHTRSDGPADRRSTREPARPTGANGHAECDSSGHCPLRVSMVEGGGDAALGHRGFPDSDQSPSRRCRGLQRGGEQPVRECDQRSGPVGSEPGHAGQRIQSGGKRLGEFAWRCRRTGRFWWAATSPRWMGRRATTLAGSMRTGHWTPGSIRGQTIG